MTQSMLNLGLSHKKLFGQGGHMLCVSCVSVWLCLSACVCVIVALCDIVAVYVYVYVYVWLCIDG